MMAASHQGIMHSKHSRNIPIVRLAEYVQANEKDFFFLSKEAKRVF